MKSILLQQISFSSCNTPIFFTEKYCAQRLETRKHGAKQKVSVLESCWPGSSLVSSLKQISNANTAKGSTC